MFIYVSKIGNFYIKFTIEKKELCISITIEYIWYNTKYNITDSQRYAFIHLEVWFSVILSWMFWINLISKAALCVCVFLVIIASVCYQNIKKVALENSIYKD